MSNTFDQVKRAIDRLDPCHLLGMHAPQDEYDPESRKISERITDKDSAEQIAAVIADVMHTAFGKNDSPARFLETAVCIRRALRYAYYGSMSDLFEYGSLSDGECIPTANEILADICTETDPAVLEDMLHALHTFVTFRHGAERLDLSPLTGNPLRFGAASAEYLPDILHAAGHPQENEILRQIHAQHPQTDLPE